MATSGSAAVPASKKVHLGHHLITRDRIDIRLITMLASKLVATLPLLLYLIFGLLGITHSSPVKPQKPKDTNHKHKVFRPLKPFWLRARAICFKNRVRLGACLRTQTRAKRMSEVFKANSPHSGPKGSRGRKAPHRNQAMRAGRN